MLEVDRWRTMVFAVPLLWVAGCAAELPEENLSEVTSVRLLRWVGVIEETDVSVAAVLGKGKARLYFCGGASSYMTTTRWLDIPFAGEHLEFQDDTWRIHAHLTAGGVLGEVERAGDAARMFNARPSEQATVAGVYEGKAACGRLGLIVTQATKNDPPTAQGACVGAEGQPILPLIPLTIEARRVAVRTDASEQGVLLQPATLEPL